MIVAILQMGVSLAAVAILLAVIVRLKRVSCYFYLPKAPEPIHRPHWNRNIPRRGRRH